jgi:lipoic acid synthetase
MKPDFQGDEEALQKVLDSKPDVLNHNIEVVKRLFPDARPQGDYDRSIELLERVKDSSSDVKSGFMLGLGESKEEIIETIGDLSESCDILTMGQYLQPTKEHMPVVKYYEPGEFQELKRIALGMGFLHVESGPLVRSSYHAADYGT